MYAIGDFVVKVNDGVCQVKEIAHLEMSGISNDRLYYLLVPVNHPSARIYVPVEGKAEELRYVLTPEESEKILNKLSELKMEWIDSSKLREQKYKEVIRSNDPEQMLACIKGMHQKRREREAAGKRNTSVDERYLKVMEDAVYTELAFSLGCKKSDIKDRCI